MRSTAALFSQGQLHLDSDVSFHCVIGGASSWKRETRKTKRGKGG